MYAQPGSPIQMAFDVTGLGGLWVCRLIKTSPSFPFICFVIPFSHAHGAQSAVWTWKIA